MKKFLAVAASAAALTGFAPAQANVTVIQNRCASLATGCAFSGNITEKTTLATQAAYNNLFGGADITLNWLFKNDDGGKADSVSFATPIAGGWSTPGFLVDFIAVKASTEFVLYKLAAPISSGSWTTAGIVNRKGETQALSHLAFFGTAAPEQPVVTPPQPTPGTAVPEPAAWAMMIAGFGVIGGMARRRKQTVRYA